MENSFLSTTTQQVVVEGIFSEFTIPQGSVLIHIIDLVTDIQSTVTDN